MAEIREMADVVALSQERVLLIKRRHEPYKGQYALPGGHVDHGEDPEAAARRELIEETGIHADNLEYIGVYDEPGRDPRYPTRSHAYKATLQTPNKPRAGDDAAEAEWVPLEAATGLAFDHEKILRDALSS